MIQVWSQSPANALSNSSMRLCHWFSLDGLRRPVAQHIWQKIYPEHTRDSRNNNKKTTLVKIEQRTWTELHQRIYGRQISSWEEASKLQWLVQCFCVMGGAGTVVTLLPRKLDWKIIFAHWTCAVCILSLRAYWDMPRSQNSSERQDIPPSLEWRPPHEKAVHRR